MRHKITRTIAGLALAAVALLAGAAACPAQEHPASPGPLTTDQINAMCPDCTKVEFKVDLYDEDRRPVALAEGWEAEVTLAAYAADPADATRTIPVQVWDVNKTTLVPSPYTYAMPVPFTDTQWASPSIVQISLEALVTLPAGWKLVCTASEFGAVVSADTAVNNAGIDPDAEGAMGLPFDMTVICTWPVDLDGFPDIP